MRRHAFLGAVFLTAGLAGCADHVVGPEPDAAQMVRAASAVAERVEVPIAVEVSGVVEAERVAAVSSRVMANVTRVTVRVGEAVRRGQALVEIDPESARGQLAQAEGALAQARAALTLARRNHERYSALAASDAASELELDLARTQKEQAEAAVRQAEGAVRAAASVASESTVVAPFDGRVLRRLVEPGDLAVPGRPLVEIESGGRRRIALSVPESLVAGASLEIGSELPVRIDARPDLGEIPARIVEISPGADPGSLSFRVIAELPDESLASGAAGRGWIARGARAAVAVPSAAVLRHGGLTLVVVLGPDGFASTRAISAGAGLPEGRVEVLSGLAGGETVLLGLVSPPAAGTRVEVLP